MTRTRKPRDGKIVDELCLCGHLKSQHSDRREPGRGSCNGRLGADDAAGSRTIEICHCEQFTWQDWVFEGRATEVKPVRVVITQAVLAGACATKVRKRTTLTHAVEIDVRGRPIRVLCGHVKLENVVGDPSPAATSAEVGCRTCRHRDPRLQHEPAVNTTGEGLSVHEDTLCNLLDALRNHAARTGRTQLAHLCTAALTGNMLAIARVLAAVDRMDTSPMSRDGAGEGAV